MKETSLAHVRAALVLGHGELVGANGELLMMHMIPKMHLETAVVKDTYKHTSIIIMQKRTWPKRGAQHMIPKMQLATAVLSKIQTSTPR